MFGKCILDGRAEDSVGVCVQGVHRTDGADPSRPSGEVPHAPLPPVRDPTRIKPVLVFAGRHPLLPPAFGLLYFVITISRRVVHPSRPQDLASE